MIQLAVSPLSWVNEVLEHLGQNTSAEHILSEAAAAGFEGVENSRAFPQSATALTTILQPHNLAFVSGWYSGFLAERDVETELSEVCAHAQMLRDAGAKVMVYGECGHMVDDALDVPLKDRRLLDSAAFIAYGERMTQFASALKSEYGLTLAYHHHLMMVAETLDEVRALMLATGPSVGLLLDTGHAMAAGFEYTILLQEFGDRIVHIHLKDVRGDVMSRVREDDLSFNMGVLSGMFTIPGDGVIDYGPLAAWLAEGHYSGWLVVEAEQDPEKAPPSETVARANTFVKQHILPASAR